MPNIIICNLYSAPRKTIVRSWLRIVQAFVKLEAIIFCKIKIHPIKMYFYELIAYMDVALQYYTYSTVTNCLTFISLGMRSNDVVEGMHLNTNR